MWLCDYVTTCMFWNTLMFDDVICHLSDHVLFFRDDRLLRLILQLLGSLLCRDCCAKFLEAGPYCSLIMLWAFCNMFSNTFHANVCLTWKQNTRQYKPTPSQDGRLFIIQIHPGYFRFHRYWQVSCPMMPPLTCPLAVLMLLRCPAGACYIVLQCLIRCFCMTFGDRRCIELWARNV